MLEFYIEETKGQLHDLLDRENAELDHGEILLLSQKLDKLIYVKQYIIIKRTQLNYKEQLHDFLSPEVCTKLTKRF